MGVKLQCEVFGAWPFHNAVQAARGWLAWHRPWACCCGQVNAVAWLDQLSLEQLPLHATALTPEPPGLLPLGQVRALSVLTLTQLGPVSVDKMVKQAAREGSRNGMQQARGPGHALG